ncbi:MAG: hypothetical protein WAN74_00895 [Thermoplasmata archaeon]
MIPRFIAFGLRTLAIVRPEAVRRDIDHIAGELERLDRMGPRSVRQ